MFFIGFETLQTYTFVSSDPEAQCLESAVQESELILAEWKAHREVIVFVEKQKGRMSDAAAELNERE